MKYPKTWNLKFLIEKYNILTFGSVTTVCLVMGALSFGISDWSIDPSHGVSHFLIRSPQNQNTYFQLRCQVLRTLLNSSGQPTDHEKFGSMKFTFVSQVKGLLKFESLSVSETMPAFNIDIQESQRTFKQSKEVFQLQTTSKSSLNLPKELFIFAKDESQMVKFNLESKTIEKAFKAGANYIRENPESVYELIDCQEY